MKTVWGNLQYVSIYLVKVKEHTLAKLPSGCPTHHLLRQEQLYCLLCEAGPKSLDFHCL